MPLHLYIFLPDVLLNLHLRNDFQLLFYWYKKVGADGQLCWE